VIRLAGNGGRIRRLPIAERAVAAALPIAPHRIEDRVEAGAPVRYGGATIGAVAVRWALGGSPDPERAIAAMTVATAAVGPIVATLLTSRQRAELAHTSALLGVSPAMIDVRRSADRAGAAPFAVLIEGESGSGKELVAREIHRSGPRRVGRSAPSNCRRCRDELVEIGLFGPPAARFHRRRRRACRRLRRAAPMLLDEVRRALSPRAQAKVLRVIQ
jgi:transcriptional regulator of aromatic amino acid metabolism